MCTHSEWKRRWQTGVMEDENAAQKNPRLPKGVITCNSSSRAKLLLHVTREPMTSTWKQNSIRPTPPVLNTTTPPSLHQHCFLPYHSSDNVRGR